MAPVLTRRVRSLAERRLTVVPSPLCLMTTAVVTPGGVLSRSLCHLRSHKQGRHPLHVALLYVV